ncbi:MAG TPA: hypothetical protein VD932_06690, partial [Aquabacterium sp.]|nr:hypothetical protein [Aquabacterium sp.]
MPGCHQRGGEGLVVDVQRQALQAPVDAGAEVGLDRGEQRAVRVGVVEGLPFAVDRGHAVLRDEEA